MRLQAMPKLGRQAVLTAEEQELEAALQQSLAEAAAELPGTSPPAPVQGISFASMTRMGYAATGGLIRSGLLSCPTEKPSYHHISGLRLADHCCWSPHLPCKLVHQSKAGAVD